MPYRPLGFAHPVGQRRRFGSPATNRRVEWGEVKRHKARELDALTRRIADLNPSSIDSLSGLEPVYEPGTGVPGLLPEEFVAVQCPYCGERLETRVDLTADEPSYIEDCQVCCRPIEFSVEREQTGALLPVKVQRVDYDPVRQPPH